MQNVLAKGGPAPCQVCSIVQSKKVLRIRWGMSQDREINPRSPLAKDKKKNLGKNKQTSALNYTLQRELRSLFSWEPPQW